MPATRSALIRYYQIDRCLRDVSRSYTLQDITEEVSNYLIEELGHDKGVSSSTIEKDIRHMRSPEGYGADIEVEKTASGWFYYYKDSKFSITKSPLDKEDARKLKGILAILDQFRHLPQFSDLEEIILKLESKYITRGRRQVRAPIVFEQNPQTFGIHFIRLFHKHIVEQQVLDITYRPFGKEARVFRVSPLLLKEYSNRWFLICVLHSRDVIMNLALDRIVTLDTAYEEYRERPDFDHDEFYSNVIGVTVSSPPKAPERILLKFHPEQGDYVRTKPLHASQKILKDNSKEFLAEYLLVPNYELKKLIWSFGDRVEVLEPLDLMTRAFK